MNEQDNKIIASIGEFLAHALELDQPERRRQRRSLETTLAHAERNENKDQKFFDMYSLVIGVLVIFAIGIFILAMTVSSHTQEVFVRSYTGLRRFHFRSEPFTWLYRTTRNVCSEFNRVRRGEPLEQEPVDVDGAPDREVSDYERARRVRQLVIRLPDRQQEVVMLRIFEDLSVAETARLMRCREGTVKALLHKATNNLKRVMATQASEDD